MIRSNSPLSITAAKTLNRHVHDNRPLLLNAVAGFTVTLPAATGSGARFPFYVGTTLTSASYVISATAGGVFVGGVLLNNTGDTTAATADFVAPAATDNTITLAFANGAGVKGDQIEIVDLAEDVWSVTGFAQAGLDPATPFSTV